jgi:hypothetical protein
VHGFIFNFILLGTLYCDFWDLVLDKLSLGLCIW